MLLGKHILPIGTDGRFTLPSDFRQDLSKVLYLTQGFERNLMLLTQSAFEKIYSHVKSTSITDPAARLLARLILGNTTELGMDQNGTLQIPANLFEFAGFNGELLLVGQGEFIELWAPAAWETLSDNLGDFSQNTQRFEKFDISLG